jgi:hypothetical protein
MPTLHNPLMEGGPIDQELHPGTGFPVWPHRRVSPSSTEDERKRPEIEDPDVSRLLKRLEELERMTRPMSGPSSAKGKDMAAFEALECAGELTARLAGWAMAHQFGLAAKCLKHVERRSSDEKNYQLHLQEQELVDSHEHEKVGAWEPGTCEPNVSDKKFTRRCLVNLLRSNSGGWPEWFCEQVLEAVEALEYGEVRPIFSPVSASRKRDYTLLNLQLSALAMIAFRCRAYAMKKENALNEVGAALNVSPHTLKSWKGRLQKEFGRLRIGDVISEAEFHGSCVKKDLEEGRLAGQVYDVSHHDALYDARALAELGEQYKAALRKDAQKGGLRI